MATSKLLKPTNVTISIPAFTDQPDQRVNSNCIDKEADAINSLSEQIVSFTLVKTAFPNTVNTYNDVNLPTGYTSANAVIVTAIQSNNYGRFLIGGSADITIRTFNNKLGIYTSNSSYLGQTVYVLLAKIDFT